MNRRRVGRLVGLLAVVGVLGSVEARAAGLQARILGFKRAGASLRVSLELSGGFSDRFRRVIGQGGTLYVRIETELWEPRTLWDRLVRPATVSVARLTPEVGGRNVVLVDGFGQAVVYPAFPKSVSVFADLIPVNRLEDAKTYYVHATATIGTIAENERAGVSGTVFGDGRESSGLGALGRYVLQKVLSVADYLDSMSCEVKGPPTTGRHMRESAAQD